MKPLQITMQYLPYVLAGVQVVEQTLGSLPGASKKQLIMAGVTAASQVGENVPEQHVQAISALIDSLVGQLNALGVFKTTPQATAKSFNPGAGALLGTKP